MKSRYSPALILLPLTTAGCYATSFLSGQCQVELVTVSWPVTLQRGATQSTLTLWNEVAIGNVGQDVFAALRAMLVEGRSTAGGRVTWGVPAFETNGGFIALSMPAPLDTGVTIVLQSGTEGGWGVSPSSAAATAAARTDAGFAEITGRASVRQRAPLRLWIELSGVDVNRVPLSIVGEAIFGLRRERRPCD